MKCTWMRSCFAKVKAWQKEDTFFAIFGLGSAKQSSILWTYMHTAMPLLTQLNEPLLIVLCSNFSFHWAYKSIKYLGVYITPDTKDLYSLRFTPLLNLKQDLQQRHSLTWFGWCKALKMMVHPRILYVFQALPITIPVTFFKLACSLFREFGPTNHLDSNCNSPFLKGEEAPAYPTCPIGTATRAPSRGSPLRLKTLLSLSDYLPG